MRKPFMLLILCASCAAGQSQTSSRIWTFQKGGKFEGAVSDFKGTNIVILISAKDHKPYSTLITNLIAEDQDLLPSIRDKMMAARTMAEFSKRAKELESRGYIELTAKLIDNFPEKVGRGTLGWMDVKFDCVQNYGVQFPSLQLGFGVHDKDGNAYSGCRADKESSESWVGENLHKRVKKDDDVLKLKRGDSVRLIGIVRAMDRDSTFTVTEIQMIHPAEVQK